MARVASKKGKASELKKGTFPAFNPWGPEYVLPYYVSIAGKDIFDPKIRSLYCRALLLGGNTVRLWGDAVELKSALINAAALQKGQKVFLVGKYIEESGLAAAVRDLIGESGQLTIADITATAITEIQKEPATNFQWDFIHFTGKADGSYDRIILFSAASHIANWSVVANNIIRLLNDSGRVIVAEDPIGGEEFVKATHMDSHIEAHMARILAAVGITEEELPACGTKDLADLFCRLAWTKAVSSSGMYVFYGQKTEKAETFSENTISLPAVKEFLKEKKSYSPWDFLTSLERQTWGMILNDKKTLDNLARGLFIAGGLHLCHDLNKNKIERMIKSMKVKRGAKILVINELFEELGTLKFFKEIWDETAQLFTYDVSTHARGSWGLGQPMAWEYPFADSYPDGYFDIIWIPQALHHNDNWDILAPKLLRALKRGGQFIAAECRVCCPDWWQSYRYSSLIKCIMEKLYLYGEKKFIGDGDPPDVSIDMLKLAFGNTLSDVFAEETKGWVEFWGFKKDYTSGDFPTAIPLVGRKMAENR